MTHQNLLLRRDDAKAPPSMLAWWMRLVFLIAIFSASAQSVWADISAGDVAKYVINFNDEITIDRPYMAFRYPSQQRQGKYDAMRKITIYALMTNGDKLKIGYMYRCFDKLQRFNPQLGRLTIDNFSDGHTDNLRLVTARFYPSAEVLRNKSVKGIRFEGLWDIDDDNSKVDDWVIKDLEWTAPYKSFDASIANLNKGTFKRTASGKLQFVSVGKNNQHAYSDSRFNYTPYFVFSDKDLDNAYGTMDATSGNLNFDLKKSVSNMSPVDITCRVEWRRTISIGKGVSYEAVDDDDKDLEQSFWSPEFQVRVPGLPIPYNLTAQYDQWKKSVSLSWSFSSMYPMDEIAYQGKWLVYRYKKGESTGAAKLVSTTDFNVRSCEVEAPEYNTDYIYIVTYRMKDWADGIAEELCDSAEVNTKRRKDDIKLTTEGGDESIRVDWTYSAFSDESAKFYVCYKSTENEAWTRVGPINHADPTSVSGTYTLDNIKDGCAQYRFRVELEAIGTVFSSNEENASISGSNAATALTASKGMFAGAVKLTWNAKQIDQNATRYVISRRILGAEGEWSDIYTASGTAEQYTYDDVNVAPGLYYEYKVTSYKNCSGSPIITKELTTDGFCQATGTISGRIAYGTGTAVKDVKVNLVQSAGDTDAKAQFYSLEVKNVGGGVRLTDKTTKALVDDNKAFTLQAWVRLDDGVKRADSVTLAKPMVFDLYWNFSLFMNPVTSGANKGKYQAVMRLPYREGKSKFKDFYTGIFVDPNRFYSVTMSYDGNYNYTYRQINEDGEISSYSASAGNYEVQIEPSQNCITIATTYTKSAEYNYKGYLDEVRMWKRALTQEEILSTYDHLLSGEEKDLFVYWPFDEGINNQQTAYDYSRTGGVPNGNHGLIQPSNGLGKITPDKRAFSVYGRTDDEGNYVIKGVPFSGAGTNYSVVPSMGVHSFTPQKLSRFVSQSSLNHSGVDFEDTSSFEVSGEVYYKGTNIPVEGCNFYVDGNICYREGEPIVSRQDGTFTISVPIGQHFIQVKKQGHEFANNGRYPKDPNALGELFTFTQPVSNLRFTDNTKVVVAGRVVGGEVEAGKPLGLKQSYATIGQAVIKLTAGSYKLNMTTGKDGTLRDSTAVRVFDNATTNVESYAYAGAGNANDTITITTDAKTGEFAVLLPPVEYKVQKVAIPSQGDILFTLSNIAGINATNPLAVQTDSIENADGTISRFNYNASLMLTHRVEPTLDVTQKGSGNAFGDATYTYMTLGNPKGETINLYEENGDTVSYAMHYPVFTQQRTYTFNLHGYERYYNKDAGAEHPSTDVPLQNSTVTITNQYASGHEVSLKPENDGEFAHPDDLEANQLQLDSCGNAEYTFMAGLPNIHDKHTRTLSIIYDVDGTQKTWQGNNAKEVIVLGELPTGTNFVTQGPDKILMVLRDPPGSNSSSFYESSVTTTEKTSYAGSFITENEATTLTKLGYHGATFVGLGAGIIIESSAKMELTVGANVNLDITDSKETTTSTTTTTRVSTSDDNDLVGADGDVFIGTGTNMTFGDVRSVDIRKNSEGNFGVDVKTITSAGLSYTTEFAYTQNSIETKNIPNLEKMRNQLLLQENEVTENTTDSVIYVSCVSPDHLGYGSSNNDKSVWGSDAAADNAYEGKSYKMLLPKRRTDDNGKPRVFQDKVRWYNEQIKLWRNALANNEKAKIDAKNNAAKYLINNYSFDGGATIENSVANSYMREDQTTEEFEVLAVVGTGTGAEISGTGVDITLKTTTGTRQSFAQTSSTENTKALGYILQEDGADDALSVDVYNAPDGFGPIFITKGGQTSCPYEDAYISKYYEPGTEISVATQQIEVPRISVEEPNVTDIPSGGTAQYTLVMQNDSETGTDMWYHLSISPFSNPDAASITIDGEGLSKDGRDFLVPAEGVLRKKLQLTQTDQSVLDYNNIQLVLSSRCQNDPTSVTGLLADSIGISAHFVPTCSDIRLSVPQRVVNSATGTKLQMTVSGYDRNFSSFRGFRIQYKGERDVDWSLAQEFVNSKDDAVNGKLEISGPSTNYVLDMSNQAFFPDQTYLVRAITVCVQGTSTEVNNESEEIQVVKDIAQPRILGNPSPAGGVLTADGEISVTFNENIKSSQLTDVDNFIVSGKLNGYKVDHEVAMRLNGGSGAQTEADIDLSKRSFTFNMWVRPEASGELLSHGTSSSKLRLSINDGGYLTADVAGRTAQSVNPLPMDTWSFLSVSYTYNENGGLLNGDFASDSKDLRLFTSVPMPVYEGNGPLAVGNGMKGAVHELTMWNKALTYAEAKDTKDVAKQASTPYLAGYWKMDEGMGTEVADAARSRNMHTESPSWYLATENKALQLDGNSSYAAIDITECSPLTTDDYALELWFRAEPKQQAEGATLFSTSDDGVRLDLNADGTLQLYSGTESRQAGTASYLDQQWHHMALNVLSDGTSALYVDGATLLQFSPAQPLRMQSNQMTLGALRKADTYGAADYKYSRFFNGQLDEVRLWKARMTKDAILAQYTERLDTAVMRPVAYYPFEKVQLDEFLQPVVSADLADHNPKSRKAAMLFGQAAIGDEAPGLKPAPREEKVKFSFTASERKVVIQLNETPSAIEGTTLKFTLRDVRDENNNVCDPIVWTAYVQQNQLKWAERELALTKQADETLTLDVEILNNSSQTEAWTVSNLPTWLQADNQSGQLNPLSTGKLRLTVPESVALGRYEQTIYLTGNKGVSEPLAVRLSVTGEKPDWQADGSKATFTMSLIGSLEMEGRLADDEADLVAAFTADGTCVGVASPKYIKRYDRHFVLMTIYGNAETSGKPVTFRAWDASTGKIHPVVKTSEQIVMRGDAVYGVIEQPVVLQATDAVEQKWQLAEGWQWMSFYVDPIEKGVENVFGPVSGWVEMLKGHDAFAVPAADGSWKGALKEVDTRQMYMANLTAPAELSVSGEQINTQLSPVTLEKGWNWIGYTPSYVASPAYALAAADPQAGDMVKSQHGFAIFQGYEWIGSFDAMQPGVGYMYLSRQQQARSFCYPLAAPQKMPQRRAVARQESAFPAVDRNAYPNNMTVIARLTDAGAPVEGAEVAVFAGEECRGVSEEIDGLYFITVSGEGSGEMMTVKVADRGRIHELKQSIVYSDNAMIGSLDSPYLLDISETVAVGSVETQGVSVVPRRVRTHVTVSSGARSLAAISVSTMSGHTVYSNQHPSPDTERIDFQSVPQGVYFVSVTTSDGRQTTVKVTK